MRRRVAVLARFPADAPELPDAQCGDVGDDARHRDRGGVRDERHARPGPAGAGPRTAGVHSSFAALAILGSRARHASGRVLFDKDAKLWATVANALPTYLDSDGLASYFPPRADDPPHGSDRLTAYVLAATHEAGFELPVAARDAMLGGLTRFTEQQAPADQQAED